MLISSRTASKISDNGMVQRGSLAPWSAFWPSPFNSQQPMDRALGVAATLALSLALLRLAGHALKYDGQEEAPSSFSSIKGVLRTILLDLYPSRQAEGQDQEWIVHRGSCHCKAIQFELIAPKKVRASRGQGKIQFPHSRTNATNFRLLKGTDHLHMYYVNVPSKGRGVEPVIAAHSFCCQCGVNILHAPNSLSSELDVNVSCLEKADIHVIPSSQNILSGGFPVPGQWKTPQAAKMGDDQFGLVSDDEDDEFEVQQDTGIQLGAQKKRENRSRQFPQECPGTPSTIGTSATETTHAASRVRHFTLDHGSVTSSDDLDSVSGSLSLGLPMARRLGGSSVASGPSVRSVMSEATTPIMRNQLKQYMSKHLPPNKESRSSKATNLSEPKQKDWVESSSL